MAKLRENIEFDSDLPDGAVETEDGRDFLVWPARPVTEALRDTLVALGCEADPIVSADFKGWEFHFRYRGRRLWCRATQIEGYLACFQDRTRLPISGGRHRTYVELLTRLNEALAANPRFRNLGWFEDEELTSEQVGAHAPDGPYDSRPLARGGDAERREVDRGRRGSDEPGSRALSEGPGSDAPRPIRRLIARLFDHFGLVGGALLLATDGLLLPAALAARPPFDHGRLLVLLVIAAGGGVLNVVFLSWTSTTPGKWLCGVKVLRRDGERLGFGTAVAREAEAVVAGCAMFVQPLFLLTAGLSYLELTRFGDTGWDRRRRLAIRHPPRWLGGAPGMLICLAAIALVAYRLGRIPA